MREIKIGDTVIERCSEMFGVVVAIPESGWFKIKWQKDDTNYGERRLQSRNELYLWEPDYYNPSNKKVIN